MCEVPITKRCMYCAETFPTTTRFGEHDGSCGVCIRCENRIRTSSNPNMTRIALEFEALREEMNNGRRI